MAFKDILYFDKPGSHNSEEVFQAVKERSEKLNINHIVVASNSGNTALKLWQVLKDRDYSLVSVTEHAGFYKGDNWLFTPEKRRELEDKGIKVLMCSHALSGISRSISKKFGGISHVEMIAFTLRLFGGEGIKVAVEISVMAADAGLIPTDKEIISIGGSAGGADSAIVLKTAHMNNFFDMEIREIIAKPRQRK